MDSHFLWFALYIVLVALYIALFGFSCSVSEAILPINQITLESVPATNQY